MVKRILVVDDENDINLTLKFVLESNDFKVETFTNPLAALQNFKSGLYDLIILDVKMLVMNGFGLYQAIRKLDDKVKICSYSELVVISIMRPLENKHFVISMKNALFRGLLKMNC